MMDDDDDDDDDDFRCECARESIYLEKDIATSKESNINHYSCSHKRTR